MSLFKNPFKSPQDLWHTTSEGIGIEYPLLYLDLKIPHDPIIKLTVDDVCGDVDFWAFQTGQEEQIIDSSGKVFLVKFETSGHWRSGIFPDKFQRKIEIMEIKDIMKNAVETHEFRIETKNEILLSIDISKTIKELLEKCSKYF